MKIKSLRVENLYSFKNLEMKLNDDMNVIVGPNNAGKTNLIRVLDLLIRRFKETLWMDDIQPKLFNNEDLNAKIEVEIILDDCDALDNILLPFLLLINFSDKILDDFILLFA